MSDRRADAIASTLRHLEWCATIPHTVDQVLGIYAERTSSPRRTMRHGLSNDEILSTLVKRAGDGGGKGGHSDPTARAALWGEPDAVDDDETVGSMRAAVALCHESAVEVGDLVADATGGARWRPPALHGLTGTVSATIAYVHRWSPSVGHAAAVMDAGDVGHLDTLVCVALAETAEWLHGKAASIWADHRGEVQQVAVQRAVVPCRVHAQWTTAPPLALPTGDLCERCKWFVVNHGCEPTAPIVRRWDYGGNATPGQVMEAKARARASA